jgi:hypothetical protein
MPSSYQDYITLFKAGLEKEKEAEHYSAKLMEELGSNSKHYEKVREIHSDEIKHQDIVKEIIKILEKMRG